MSSKGTSLLYILNFDDNRFTFDFMKNQFKLGTSKDDLSRLFPNSFNSLIEKHQSYNKEGHMKINMKETPDLVGSNGWILSFKGELLNEIQLWWFIC